MKQSIVIERLESKIKKLEEELKAADKQNKILSKQVKNIQESKQLKEENERLKRQVERLIEQHKTKDRKIWELQTLNETRDTFFRSLFGDGENGEKIDTKQFWKDIDEAKRKSDEDYWDGIDLTEEDIIGP